MACRIDIRWIRAHYKNVYNDRADELAKSAAQGVPTTHW